TRRRAPFAPDNTASMATLDRAPSSVWATDPRTLLEKGTGIAAFAAAAGAPGRADASSVLGVPALRAHPGRMGSAIIHATTPSASVALPIAAVARLPIETLRVHPRRNRIAISTATRHARFAAAAQR